MLKGFSQAATVHSPWASVHGRLRLGDRLIPASGQCCGDRSLNSYPLRDFTNSTFYFRTFSPASAVLRERWMLYLQVYETHSLSLPRPLRLAARCADY